MNDINVFEMRSTDLVSDYDFVPTGISDEQKQKCEDCWYRWRMIELELATYERRSPIGKINFGEPTPNCDREKCVIDNQDPRNIIKLKKLAFVGARKRR